MSEVQILLLLLLSGYLISVSLGMVIIPRILVISHKKRLYDVPDSRKVHDPSSPLGWPVVFSRGLDVVCLGDRLSPLSVALGSV